MKFGTGNLIEESRKNAADGMVVSSEVTKTLQEIVESNHSLSELIDEISSASKEQSQGMSQVNEGINGLEKVSQQNAAMADKALSASEELSLHAEGINIIIEQLASVIGQNSSKKAENKTTLSKMLKPGKDQVHGK